MEYFKLNNGFEKILYMTKDEVEAWRDKYSPSAKSNYSPWKTEFDKMALKTCLRRLISTYGIMTLEMADVMEKDGDNAQQRAEQTVASNANSTVIDIDTETGEVVEQPQEQPQAQTIAQPDF